MIRRIIKAKVFKTIIAFLGLIATLLTIYAFFQENKVNLRYEIVSETNVLDFNADLTNLEVIYDSTNLKQTGENLRIYTIKMINTGNQTIIKEYYDSNAPTGIKLSSGLIIEHPELIQSSNDYLKNNVKIKKSFQNKILISDVIIEPKEFIIFKLLVLHKKEALPQIIPLGKIAGQKDITIVNSFDSEQNIPLLEKVLFGNILIQLSRLIIYFIIGVLLFLSIDYLNDKRQNFKNRSRKKKHIKSFKDSKNYFYAKTDDVIFERYLDKGARYLREIYSLMNENDETVLQSYYEAYLNNTSIFSVDHNDFSTIINLGEMFNDGLLYNENNNLKINPSAKNTLEKFIQFLDDNVFIEKNSPVRLKSIIND